MTTEERIAQLEKENAELHETISMYDDLEHENVELKETIHNMKQQGTDSQPGNTDQTVQQTGVALIAAERRRQIAAEGFSAEYDDTRLDSELAWAACYYAMPCPLHVSGCGLVTPSDIFDETGFDTQWAKRDNKSRVRQLAVAGALIAAEIDRLQRAGLDYGGQQPGDQTEASA